MATEKNGDGLKAGKLAVISDIQRYSVHDGPGIRTVVFFKGCPLRCKWCHNPETFSPMPEVIYEQADCIGCGRCMDVCPAHAISVRQGALVTDRIQCMNCGKCTAVCSPKARKMAGGFYSIDSLLDLVNRDRVFYEQSGGGVTLSGGEVTMQSAFARNLLLALKARGIHTAVETCAFASPEDFSSVALNADLILFDLKHPDPEKHRLFTEADNVLIHQNLQTAIASGKKVIARYPLIPGVNDSRQDVEATGSLCKRTGLEEIHLLPFHQSGESKWRGLDLTYGFKGQQGMRYETAKEAASMLEAFGLKVSIGGSGA